MIEMEFLYWIDAAAVGGRRGVIQLPQVRVGAAMAQKALTAGVSHGRITLWLWIAKGKKMAFAMARIGGENPERPVKVVRGAPPFSDADKAEFVYRQERR